VRRRTGVGGGVVTLMWGAILLEAREMDEWPDLCDIERAEGGAQEGEKGYQPYIWRCPSRRKVRHFTVCTRQGGRGGVLTRPTYQTLSVTHWLTFLTHHVTTCRCCHNCCVLASSSTSRPVKNAVARRHRRRPCESVGGTFEFCHLYTISNSWFISRPW